MNTSIHWREFATAVLSLAQIYVDTNQAEKAVELLENDKIGALTLAQRGRVDEAMAQVTRAAELDLFFDRAG